MTCSTCGCSPCSCQNPGVLNQPRIMDPTISGGTWVGATLNGPTVNGGTLTGSNLIGATIDCTTLGCTQPPGTNDATLATTAFVDQAINDALTDPSFCSFVSACLAGAPALCSEIINCINTTPGSINNPIAFDPAVGATTLQAGVIRVGTLAELQGASCLVAIDPCTLEAFFNAGGPNTLWNAFAGAVDSLLTTSATLCAAVFACGAAPLASPVFTGDPQAPTQPLFDNDTSIATTAFVQGAIASALAGSISSGNPAFCAAVAGCVSGAAVVASGRVRVNFVGGTFDPAGSNYITGAFYGALPAFVLPVTFNVAQPDTNYSVVVAGDPTAGGGPNSIAGIQFGSQTPAGFNLLVGGPGADYDLNWAVVRA